MMIMVRVQVCNGDFNERYTNEKESASDYIEGERETNRKRKQQIAKILSAEITTWFTAPSSPSTTTVMMIISIKQMEFTTK